MKQETPLALYRDLYRQTPILDSVFQIMASLITKLPDKLDQASQNLSEILGERARLWLNMLAQNLDIILDDLMEDIAAKTLIEKFGVPQSLFAIPVAIELAEWEIKWRKKLISQVTQTETIRQALLELIQTIILAITTQLIQTEDEVLQHEAAMADQQLTMDTYSVQTLHMKLEQKLKEKINLLKAKQSKLQSQLFGLKHLTQYLTVRLSQFKLPTVDRSNQIFAGVN